MAKGKTVVGTEKAEPKRTECPITRAQFEEAAKPLLLKVTGANMPVGEDDKGNEVTMPRSLAVGVQRNKETGEVGFATGSLGWGFSDKMDMQIDGVPVKCQVSINITVVNSKDAR